MSRIRIERDHDLGRAGARQVAEQVAADLARRFPIRHHWEGDVMHVNHSGARGTITVAARSLALDVRVGLLLLPVRRRLEQEIERQLDEILDNA